MFPQDAGRVKKLKKEGVTQLPQEKRGNDDGKGGAGVGVNARQDGDYFVAEHDLGANRIRVTQGGEQRVQSDPNVSQGQGEGREGQGTGDTMSEGELRRIYAAVVAVQGHNYRGARVPVPSGLCIGAWRSYLQGYSDQNLVEFLTYGWPVNCDLEAMLQPTYHNHPSAQQFSGDIQFYLNTELGFGALGGPYATQPFAYMQLSPLMTRPKKDSNHRRVIMDLSWPPSASVNDAIQGGWYVDGPMAIRLPTVDYMEGRLLQLGRGAYLYKTDLARGYRQLRVDPSDWPLLGFSVEGKFYFDMCPPFGLRTSRSVGSTVGKVTFLGHI